MYAYSNDNAMMTRYGRLVGQMHVHGCTKHATG